MRDGGEGGISYQPADDVIIMIQVCVDNHQTQKKCTSMNRELMKIITQDNDDQNIEEVVG